MRREQPSTSAALPTDVSRSTTRDRFVESARVFAHKTPFVRVPRVPVLINEEVLFPEQHIDVTAAKLYDVFHRTDTLERSPLLLVTAPVPDDGEPRLVDPPFMGTLARVRTDGDDNDGVRLEGLHRVQLDALPSSARELVLARPRPLIDGDAKALHARIRAPFEAFLRGPVGIEQGQIDLIVKLPAVFLAYFVARITRLPLRTQDFILRIDDAEELVEVASEMAEAGASAVDEPSA